MGISPVNAQAIIREHLFKPLTGTVMAIGRQTFLFSPEDALRMFESCGVASPMVDPATIPLDNDTKNIAAGRYIRDDGFFKLLGIDDLRSLDVDAYEGADVIHDLNQPLPTKLENIADVIIDGSTLDNVFNPAEAIRNLSKMLRPGGRLISFNMGSNHYNPYLILTPGWLYDFFVVNEYSDCRLYAVVYDGSGSVMALTVDPKNITPEISTIWNVQTPHTMGLCVIAEKGKRSTSDRSPTQIHYATPEIKNAYTKALEPIRASARPDHYISTGMAQVSAPEIYRTIPCANSGYETFSKPIRHALHKDIARQFTHRKLYNLTGIGITGFTTIQRFSLSRVEGNYTHALVTAKIQGATNTRGFGLVASEWIATIDSAAPTIDSFTPDRSAGTAPPKFRLAVEGNDILVQVASSDKKNPLSQGFAEIEMFLPDPSGVGAVWAIK